jgi:hypothetical protein
MWGRTLQVTLTPLDAWVGPRPGPAPTLEAVLERYLAAFGPATVADAAAWSRLTGLAGSFEALRPRLAVFRDERGRQLFDRPDAPRPDEDVPAPVRLLPEYDNVLLSHADRSRFLAGAERQRLGAAAPPVKGTALVDGRVQATWYTERDRRTARASLVVHHLPLAGTDEDALRAEAERVAAFWLGGAETIEVRLVAVP